MRNLTKDFLKRNLGYIDREIKTKDLYQCRKIILDYIGVTYLGSRLINDKMKEFIKRLDKSDSKSSLIGYNKKTSMEDTAFINGFSAHVADYDDGSNAGIIHLAAPILSSLMVLLDNEEVSSIDFYRGVIFGYEIAYKLANSIQPFHKLSGYHATGTCGALGATVALCVAAKTSFSQMVNAFTLTAINTSATLKVLEGKSELKPLNVARASSLAINSFKFSNCMFDTPDDILSGDFGFLRMMSSKVDLEQLFLENGLAINKTYIKVHASCRYTHPAIDAVLNLKKEHGLDNKVIKKVKVETYSLAVKNHDHTVIESSGSGRMSIPYCVSIALNCGNATFDKFEEQYIQNNDIKSLTEKVEVLSSTEYSDEFPLKQIAKVTIYMINGSNISDIVDFPLGEPENPATIENIIEKYNNNMKIINIPQKHIENLSFQILNDNLKLADLSKCIRRINSLIEEDIHE
ncbi:2-methylcitrate dehydratase [Candidatus Izimaplasma bacterium HR1]|jgi:2-methylcitrate dehydratase PrpD|uniref:MmgE/PrpD family protein n=1 Tax=Candidatus Izimoplasma sp. HR1 TaxID=1541959 RepID=UPI0004F589A6|nr:2-methylcitrate dehydratase [Candidatus Izimaplasma bacterium HR1]